MAVVEMIAVALALERVQAKHVSSTAPSSEIRPGGPTPLKDIFPAIHFYGLGSFVYFLVLQQRVLIFPS